MCDHSSKLVMLLILSISFITFSSAQSQWEFEPYTGDLNVGNLSQNSSSIILTDLKTSGNDVHLNPDNINNLREDGSYARVEYKVLNNSNPVTVTEPLSYSEKLGSWYGDIETNYSEMSYVNFTANGTAEGEISDSNQEATFSYDVNVGNYTVELIDNNLPYGMSDEFKAERQMKPDVRIRNTTGDIIEEASVKLYFHDTTAREEVFSLDNYNEDEGYYFNAEVDTPTDTNSTYVMRIVAENQSEGLYGSQSFFVDTAPAIKGNTTVLESADNCDDEEMVSHCEVNTTLDVEFGVTAAYAEYVNATVYGFNSTTGDKEILTEVEMNSVSDSGYDTEKYGQYFESEAVIPDINTSEWDQQAQVQIHSWNIDRSYNETYPIDLETFRIEDRSNPTALTGRTHEIRLRLGKYFSLSGYGPERFQSLETVLSGPEEEYYFDKSNLTYDSSSNVFTSELLINANASEATYNLETTAVDIFGEEKTRDTSLTVEDIEQTFEVTDEVNLEYQENGEFQESLEFENMLDTAMTVKVNSDSETIIMDEEISLEPNEEASIDYTVNRTVEEDELINVVFEDNSTGYFVETEFNVESPDCGATVEGLCVEETEISSEIEDPQEYNETVTVTNNDEDPVTANISVEGNITDLTEVQERIEVTDTEELDMLVRPYTSGYYNGSLVLSVNDSEASIPVSFDVNIEEIERSLSVDPESLDLGTLGAGESVTETFTVENTGSEMVEGLMVSSNDMSVESEEYDLESGDEQEIDVTFVSPETGEIKFSGSSIGREANVTAEVTANTVEDVTENTDRLNDRISDLRDRTDSTDIENRLTEVETMISQINTQWESGDYEQAQSTFDDAQSRLNDIDSDISTQDSQDPENPDNSQEGTQDEQNEESSGGLPILPILAILTVLMMVGGFIFYESYIPEEGDPLYGVMGE